jgi:hypothetical protein
VAGLLGLGGTAEALAQEKLDGGDTGADIRDGDLSPMLPMALRALERHPVLSEGS